MIDITKTKREFEKKCAQHFCHVNDVDQCPNKEHCTCKLAAEIKAYIREILPEPFSKLTLDDFDGCDKNNNRLISAQVALNAKQSIISYCWKNVSLSDLVGPKKIGTFELDSKSIIDKRYDSGDNVVIYSDSSTRGKTFVASLIMREAIKRRGFPGHLGDTYDWINFRSLVDKLKQERMGDKEIILSDTKYCDWLVVDDIPNDFATSARGQNYIASVLDPFFFDRLQEKLPTILVFKFNIMQSAINLEQSFGTAMNKMVNDSRTCLISLCENI